MIDDRNYYIYNTKATIAKAAKDYIDTRSDFLGTLRYILENILTIEERNEDIQLLLLIESETEHLPSINQYKKWSSDRLPEIILKVKHVEDFYIEDIINIYNRIITNYNIDIEELKEKLNV